MKVIELFKTSPLAYCDYLADQCQRALEDREGNRIIDNVGKVKSDLHPTGGYMLSTKKTIEVTDRNGRRYLITVAEIEK